MWARRASRAERPAMAQTAPAPYDGCSYTVVPTNAVSRHRPEDRRRHRAGARARHRPDLADREYALAGEEPFMGRISNKIAIVTGAGQGIGKAIAEKLAAEGTTVVVTDLDEAAARRTATALPAAVAIAADVTDRQGVQSMTDRVLQQFGRIDVLVNNAGWDKASPFVDSDPADWDRAIAVNLYGVLHTCKAVLPIMAGQASGAVVNLGSDAGRVGSSGEAVYSAAKGGVIAFTKSLAREMARHQVRVNCVCPGPTDTALFASFAGPKLREALTRAIPFQRLGQPADIANVVAFLASDEASFVTGQTISVSGGLTMS